MLARSDLHQTITPDQEAIVLLAHKLCVSERKRLAWQKTAEMEQDRADENDRKFTRTFAQLHDATDAIARLTERVDSLKASIKSLRALDGAL